MSAKSFLTLYFILPILFLTTIDSEAKVSKEIQKEIEEFTQSMIGNEFFLRFTVLRVTARGRIMAGKATDATNVFPDGQVYYQGTIEGGVQINTQDPNEFTAEARRKLLAAENNKAAVLSIDRGAKILIHDVEVEDDETRIMITVPGSFYSEIKSTVRFKMFDDVNSLDTFKSMFNSAFATKEHEVKRVDKTTVINQNASIEELVTLLGYADYRINLDEKTILVYDQFKFVFMNGQLVDFQ